MSCFFIVKQVRLWSVTGFYVGHFGQSTPWNLSSLVDYHKESYDRPLPYDVKKVASSTTLMVCKSNGYCGVVIYAW